MRVPAQLISHIKNQLNQDVLALQNELGRGAWIVSTTGKAQYVLLQDLPLVFGATHPQETRVLLTEVARCDFQHQIVCIFNFNPGMVAIATIDLI